MDADRVAGRGQFALDIVNGQIAFAHSDDEIAHPIAGGGVLRSGACRLKEAVAVVGFVAELMTKDAEGAGRIAKAARDLGRRKLIAEVSAESFVLALERRIGCREEEGGLPIR